MQRLLGGGLVALTITSSLLTGGVAAASTRFTHVRYTERWVCYAGPADGPILATLVIDNRVWTKGAKTGEVGTTKVINPANGRSHTFRDAGVVTALASPNGFHLKGALVWFSRGDLNYVVGTASTVGSHFDEITRHHGRLSEACESVA